jgi:hypothetical protein
LYMLLASPAQSFSGPSPLDLATIFYSLSFETSLFVASHDSQGHGRGIRPRLHTGRQQCLTTSRYIASARAAQKNVSSIILRPLVAEVTCPQSCSLATAVVLLLVYTAVTRQFVYMS